MSKTVYTIDEGSEIGEAAKLMAQRDIGSLVVMVEGKPVGIITERDVMREVSRPGGDHLQRKVSSVASKPLVTISPSTEIWKAFATMLRKKVRRLPVVKNGNILGIVTERDLLKWVVEVFYEPNLPADIKQLLAQNP